LELVVKLIQKLHLLQQKLQAADYLSLLLP
jgi:hypothetical protein